MPNDFENTTQHFANVCLQWLYIQELHVPIETHTHTHSLTHSQRVVELSKQYLPQLSCGFSDARVKVHYRDGAEFMAEHSDEFDIIITDSSDPIGRDCGSEMCVW